MTSVNPYKFILQVCLVLAAKGSPSQRRRGGGRGQNKKTTKKATLSQQISHLYRKLLYFAIVESSRVKAVHKCLITVNPVAKSSVTTASCGYKSLSGA